MKKFKRFFRHLHNSSIWAKFLFFTLSMVCVIIVYYAGMRLVNRSVYLIEDDFSWIYQIDSIEVQDNNLIIEGWAFEENSDANYDKYEIVLYEINTEKKYFPKMNYLIREDVNAYFSCKYDYTRSGFKATISTSKFDIENSVFQILISPQGTRAAIGSNIFWANEKMHFTNPIEFTSLDVQGTDIEQVVNKGQLRVYRADVGMYVYQYDGFLYWIAEEDYGFVNNDTGVTYQMNTTQIDKLPEDRLANHWYWSNLGFKFSTNELLDWNTGKYRVAREIVPKEYSITHIWTGNYAEQWIWKEYFRPWYELQNDKIEAIGEIIS